MGKVLYSVTMSLDGYIAGPGGDMSWLAPYLGPNPEIDGLQQRIGSLLIAALGLGDRALTGSFLRRSSQQR